MPATEQGSSTQTTPSRKVTFWDVYQEVLDLEAIGMPRTVIAEKLGIKRLQIYRHLGPKKKRTTGAEAQGV